MKRAHPVVDLLAFETSRRWVREWRVKAVQMPALVAIVALDDRARRLALRRAATVVAQHSVALAVLDLVVIRLLVITSAIPVGVSASLRKRAVKQQSYLVLP